MNSLYAEWTQRGLVQTYSREEVVTSWFWSSTGSKQKQSGDVLIGVLSRKTVGQQKICVEGTSNKAAESIDSLAVVVACRQKIRSMHRKDIMQDYRCKLKDISKCLTNYAKKFWLNLCIDKHLMALRRKVSCLVDFRRRTLRLKERTEKRR